ncbi:hypothetical protein SAMN04488057_12046 [Cyclobacterium lianum]|uniref:Uncharacterized protein n=1 Tax=Cyclobacterium lianum TaxID=388280 RepID=A0A1M7QM57_9BACT|nr:hypothetical protein [Cyclobacterium lianum]SHN32439.1 hypothetical protein SAMN04488057_12046 [Cyclobacterium lianum]
MKSNWLFLPDIFLVLLICFTCERNEMTHVEENQRYTFKEQVHFSGNAPESIEGVQKRLFEGRELVYIMGDTRAKSNENGIID